MPRLPRLRASAAAFAALLAIGCGGGEARFDAESLAAELSSAGVTIELGAPLDHSSGEAREVTLAATDEDHPDEPAGEDAHGHEDGGGAVIVFDDTDAAVAELERCESALSFTCFRAANVVLRFSELPREETARLAVALTALADESD